MDKETFLALEQQWKDETEYLSSITKIVSHPSYRQIVDAGECVIPYIFESLRKEGGHWFIALRELTGANPPKYGDRFDDAVRAWLDWASKNGY